MADYKVPIITGTSLTTGDVIRWNGSAWVNYTDSAYAPTAHTHDGDTLQLDGVNSDGGAFSFTTSGTVTFSQSIASSGLTTGSVLFAAANGVVSQDNSNLFWDNTNKHLGIGINSGIDAGLTLYGGGDISKLRIFDTDNDAGSPELIFNKSRSGGIVSDEDYCGRFFARGHDGIGYENVAGICFHIDGTPAEGSMPGSIVFLTTPVSSTELSTRLTIDAAGLSTFTGSIISANFESTNKLTACATNAGGLDFSAVSKTLTVEDNAIVSQDYSSDASPTFANVILADGGALKVADGDPQIVLDNANGYVEITGNVGIGQATPGSKLDIRTGNTEISTGLALLTLDLKQATELTGINAGEGPRILFKVPYSGVTSKVGGAIEAVKTNSSDDNSSAVLRFYTSQDDETLDHAMTIDENGNVGIYTLSPDTKLQVVGDCKFGDDNTNYISIGTTGNVTFTGSAGFYPRVLNQSAEPAAGTGATQCDTGELVMWTDTDDSKCYMCYNHGGTVKTVELT